MPGSTYTRRPRGRRPCVARASFARSAYSAGPKYSTSPSLRVRRGQQRDQRGFVEREAIVGRDVVGGRGVVHVSPSLASSQSNTGRHSVSRWREAKKPSWPMRALPASAGVYQRDSRAAFG